MHRVLAIAVAACACAGLSACTASTAAPLPSASGVVAVAVAGQTATPGTATTPSPSPSLASTPARSGAAPLPNEGIDLGGPAPVGSFLLGDSIGLSIAPTLSSYGYPVVAIVGQSLSEAYLREYLSGDTAQAAPAWIIELGTNNRGDAADLARLPSLLDVVDSLRARQQVYWVLPFRSPDYRGGLSAWQLDAFNAEVRRLADERPWLSVLDYATLAQQNPAWFADDAAHLHPDEQGQDALVHLIAGIAPSRAPKPAPVESGSPKPTPAPVSTAQTFENAPVPSPDVDPAPSGSPSSPSSMPSSMPPAQPTFGPAG